MNYFDQRAKDWDADPMKAERARAVAEAMRRMIPLSKETSALEYGCGAGLLSFALHAELGEIVLADTSQGMLEALTAKIESAGVKNMRPLRLDLTVGPLPARRFDAIYSLMTLHHIPDVDDVLKKFHALLHPGGFLFAADLDKEDGSFHTEPSGEAHNGFEREALKRKVEAAGFAEVRFETAYVIRKKIGEEQKDFPLFALAAQKK